LAHVTPITASLEVGEPLAVIRPASDDIVSLTVLRYGTRDARSTRQTTGESPKARDSKDPPVLVDNKSVVEIGKRYRSKLG